MHTHQQSARRRVVVTAIALIATVALGAAGCSSSGGDTDDAKAARAQTAPTIAHSDGPTADLSEELTGGNGVFLGAASAPDNLAAAGYEEHEYVAAGTATAYTAPGGLPNDGRFALQQAGSADYRTRIVVRRPVAPADFNGTVIVEWLNVSGGVDANPDYAFMADELVRGGYAWVGVSAQQIGVEGGPVAVSIGGAAGDVAGKGLKALDPARYGSLAHPGDAYAYDIYTQVARALRASGGPGPLAGLDVERIIAVGESQSAFALTTYVNGVQPVTRTFDGFLLHSRGGSAAPLGEGGGPIDIASAVTAPKNTIVRTDTEVPVLTVETETDLVSIIGFYPARQDDTEMIRLWEVAGTAHADRSLVGDLADTLDCGAPINDGPQGYVVRSALRALDEWVRTGDAPPVAPRLEVDTSAGSPRIRRDANGLALGGIRTAPVDAPVSALSGDPGSADASIICLLLGSARPLTAAQLAALYPDRAAYIDAYTKATDAAIAAGAVIPEDRQAMLDDAQPERIAG